MFENMYFWNVEKENSTWCFYVFWDICVINKCKSYFACAIKSMLEASVEINWYWSESRFHVAHSQSDSYRSGSQGHCCLDFGNAESWRAMVAPRRGCGLGFEQIDSRQSFDTTRSPNTARRAPTRRQWSRLPRRPWRRPSRRWSTKKSDTTSINAHREAWSHSR